MKRLEFLVRMVAGAVATVIGLFLIVLGIDSVSASLIVPGFILLTGGFVFNIKATHDRLKDIFTGHDMWMVWGGYILLSIIPVVSLVTLAIFFLPSGKFAKKG